MNQIKEDILRLRNEGKSYSEIQKDLNCSKGTISYYCGEGQKEKNRDRTRKLREENIMIKKIDNFKSLRNFKNIKESLRKFQKRDGNDYNKNIKETFNWRDVLDKFGENTFCYLCGEEVNLFEDTYSFDHIIPQSRGGDNSLDNLGITMKKINDMKTDMTPDELVEMCIKILKFNNYSVEKLL
jgi:5-methylcytosine-specific restriction endonuclease McrA